MQEFADWYGSVQARFTVKAWVARPSSYDANWLNVLFYEFGPTRHPSGCRIALPV